jgi:hypothetical protein
VESKIDSEALLVLYPSKSEPGFPADWAAVVAHMAVSVHENHPFLK